MLKKHRALFLVSLFFLLPGLAFLACKKESQVKIADVQETAKQDRTAPIIETEQVTSAHRPTGAKTKPAGTDTQKRIISLQDKQQDKSTAPPHSQRSYPPVTNSSEPVISIDNELFLSINTTGVLFPDDFKIGPVLNTYQMHTEHIKVFNLVTDFFNSLVKKEINKELIEEHRRDLLAISLNYYLKSNLILRDFRLGEVRIEDADLCSIKVRFFSDKTSSEGFIYLLKESGKWLITDVQINFLELAAQEVKSQEKFRPTLWREYDN